MDIYHTHDELEREVEAGPPLVGRVIIDFLTDRARVGIVASDSSIEKEVRTRLDLWAVEHVGDLLQRRSLVLPATASCGGPWQCRKAGQ